MRRQVAALIALGTLAAVAVALLWLAPWSSGSSTTGDTPSPAAPQAPPGQATPFPTATPAPPAGTPRSGGYGLSKLLESQELEQAVEFALIPGSSDAAVVATQEGKMWRVSLSGGPPSPFGDISGRLASGGEQGLLAFAFSPDFQSDGRVYLYYTKGSPQPSVLSRFQATAAHLDENSEQVLLQAPQPFANHNGGHIVFGHDGMLYLSLGDGGSGGDPDRNGQNTNSLLGKVLRIDVSGSTYAVPRDNPFAGGGGRGEVFAYGLRNAWRMTVDSLTGDIWLGDVGQAKWEEVDRLVKGDNYGWNCYEGPEPYDLDGCPPSGFQAPRAYYGHDEGSAVTGGFVYRGSALPELYGWYIYADFYSGNVWAVDTEGSAPPVHLMDAPFNTSSFTLAADGEVYFVSYSDGIYELTR
jgi:glucose/arabinose dehydrogenase